MEPDSNLPFFVYGTLLDGESNHHLLRKATVSCAPARLEGFLFYDLGPYPMIVEGTGSVIGELVRVEAALYAKVLQRLDQLEGVDGDRPEDPRGLYRRVRLQVTLTESGEEREAWVYVGRESTARRGLLRPGDWRNRFNKDGS